MYVEHRQPQPDGCYAGDTNNTSSTNSTSAAVVQTVDAAVVAGPMTWQYGYDAMGRPTTVLDPNG